MGNKFFESSLANFAFYDEQKAVFSEGAAGAITFFGILHLRVNTFQQI